MPDGVYLDDPSEALAYLQDKVLAKKLTGGSIAEIRPCSLPMGPTMLALARMKAANRMDLQMIPRVAIGPRHGHEVTIRVLPQQGKSPGQVEGELLAAGVSAPGGAAGTVGTSVYRFEIPADTPAESVLSFAQGIIVGLGVQPGQGWQWINRGRDQVPD
jgi:hypothetical protein